MLIKTTNASISADMERVDDDAVLLLKKHGEDPFGGVRRWCRAIGRVIVMSADDLQYE